MDKRTLVERCRTIKAVLLLGAAAAAVYGVDALRDRLHYENSRQTRQTQYEERRARELEGLEELREMYPGLHVFGGRDGKYRLRHPIEEGERLIVSSRPHEFVRSWEHVYIFDESGMPVEHHDLTTGLEWEYRDGGQVLTTPNGTRYSCEFLAE